jgi:DNA-directed RNA polymerase subunit RPC12/RpoP
MKRTRIYPSREVKCQICSYRHRRFFGKGLLVRPCPVCGSRVTFAVAMPGDPPVTPDATLTARAA